ncbi:SagB family peptide dehydrogenase [Hyphomicrobium sp.]|uniref:SagB family peptide dehydrogenase n=1 Tax=Hyphomicrobium sp. TaxID=82 RepID=UPI001DDF7B35|nr:SagB family peptide dehydrogenase [Hyphomicrobium sp.]MBY0558930.1 SagB family peptide dehydrogenase [Hyphomicrobium sp.]
MTHKKAKKQGGGSDHGAAYASRNSKSEYLQRAERAQQLFNAGDPVAARRVFAEILGALDASPSFARATTMDQIGRCFLAEGSFALAIEQFEQAIAISRKLPATPGVHSLQATLQSDLGEALRCIGEFVQARSCFLAAIKIGRSIGDKRAEAVDTDRLGSMFLREGMLEEATSSFKTAISLFSQVGDRTPLAIVHHHLGVAYQSAGRYSEAENEYRVALELMEATGEIRAIAACSSALADVLGSTSREAEAEVWHRKALDAAFKAGNDVEIRRCIVELTQALRGRADCLSYCRSLLENALARAGHSLDRHVWQMYGLLGHCLRDTFANSNEPPSGAVLTVIENCLHISDLGPSLLATLEGLGPRSSFARAVMFDRLAHCCIAGQRPRTAVLLFRDALQTLQDPVADEETSDSKVLLQHAINNALGHALHFSGKDEEAVQAFETALSLSQTLGDLRGEAAARENLLRHPAGGQKQWGGAENIERLASIEKVLGDVGGASSNPMQAELDSQPTEASSSTGSKPKLEVVRVSVREYIRTEIVFGSDLVVDLPRQTKVTEVPSRAVLAAQEAVIQFSVGVRTWRDSDGNCIVHVPAAEPLCDIQRDCVILRRIERQLEISDSSSVVWSLVREIDGTKTAQQVLNVLPGEYRDAAASILSALTDSGAIDVSGRPIGSYLHLATKKGTYFAPGIVGEEILNLASDGEYRDHHDATRIDLSKAHLPSMEAFETLRTLTRGRRSRRDYSGKPVDRNKFDALLDVACGITGVMPWRDREIKLRAYPSSGALYAVEIYPIIFNVSDHEPGVYHYSAPDHALNVVNRQMDRDTLLASVLPSERQMVSGAATFICLTGRFKRHERKYGQGGYRMMVAEAGHISQNLVLAATSLGLAARPFGGVFDSLLNRELGLNEIDEQFLLGVLVGLGES